MLYTAFLMVGNALSASRAHIKAHPVTPLAE